MGLDIIKDRANPVITESFNDWDAGVPHRLWGDSIDFRIDCHGWEERDAGMFQLIVAGSKSWCLVVKTDISQGIVPRATLFKPSSIGDSTVYEAQPGHRPTN